MKQALQGLPKRPGRPKGTGINDGAFLRAIAEEFDQTPAPSAYAAVQAVVTRVYPDDEALRALNIQRASIIHRLAKKWREEGGIYLDAVTERKRQERAERAARSIAGFLAGVAELQREFARAAEWARPLVEAAANRFEAALRSPEGQEALKFMSRIQALQRDPKIALWMGGRTPSTNTSL